MNISWPYLFHSSGISVCRRPWPGGDEHGRAVHGTSAAYPAGVLWRRVRPGAAILVGVVRYNGVVVAALGQQRHRPLALPVTQHHGARLLNRHPGVVKSQ